MPSTISPNDPLTKEFVDASDAEEILEREVRFTATPSANAIAQWHAAEKRVQVAFDALQMRG